MSGEAGGLIIGGLLLAAIAPVVITGAAVIGVTYAAIRIGGFLMKHASVYAAEKKREKELVVGQCSTQLDAVYRKLQETVRQETQAHTDYAQEMGTRMMQLGEQLKDIRIRQITPEEIDEKAASGLKAIQKELGVAAQEKREEIIRKGNEQMQVCLGELEKGMQAQSELVQWTQQGLAALAMQKAISEEMLRDALASVNLLLSMAQNSTDYTFQRKVTEINATYRRAQSFYDQKMYQGAFSSARTVIREAAITATEHVQDEMEMDMAEMELRAKLEGLRADMEAQRNVSFQNTTRRDQKVEKVDLNAFSQGKYAGMIESIDQQLALLDQLQGRASSYEMKKMKDTFDREMEPRARRIIARSKQVMIGYYERLHVLEVIADFMVQQNYEMDWAMPVGGDLSQKLVVHFKQVLTGNTVSIALDSDVQAGQLADMAMEIMTFYGNGRDVTEAEKQQLREDLMGTLSHAGLSGHLSCKGNVSMPSSRLEFDDREKVREMKPEQVVE